MSRPGSNGPVPGPRPAPPPNPPGPAMLGSSDVARRYVADFFARDLRRHDFAAYIATELAADFACVLAKHLAALKPAACTNCDGSGMIGYTSGQTAEQFDQGVYPCPECAEAPPPVHDLEQFRKPVERWKLFSELGVDVESMPMHFQKSPEKYAADVVEADRLLALIGPRRAAAPGPHISQGVHDLSGVRNA